VAISIVGFYLLALVQTVAAAKPAATCELPKGVQRKIANKYPGAKIVSLSDLTEDNKGLFQKDHGDTCPGIAKVDFYGDHKPTLAIVLISGDGAKQKAELVVAHQAGTTWTIASLEIAKSSVPVVWSQEPGSYQDVYGEKTIRATRPVIVFGEYYGWIILYSWTGRNVDKIWLID
jgi:hypothetical protein